MSTSHNHQRGHVISYTLNCITLLIDENGACIHPVEVKNHKRNNNKIIIKKQTNKETKNPLISRIHIKQNKFL